jgi:hypothetical protein
MPAVRGYALHIEAESSAWRRDSKRETHSPLRGSATVDTESPRGKWRSGISINTSAIILLGAFIAGIAVLSGCELVPVKPEAVFVLYRDRMKAGDLKEARALLSDQSRTLAINLGSKFKLKQPAENLALLNALDPVSPPLVMKQGDTYALLQARTLKGGLRLIHLVRTDKKAAWKIDLVEELNALRKFLETRDALNMIREQAGEYAAFWRAFNDQLQRMRVPEPRPDLRQRLLRSKKKRGEKAKKQKK